jgi:hypothetical protein
VVLLPTQTLDEEVEMKANIMKVGRCTKEFGDVFTPPAVAEKMAADMWPGVVAKYRETGKTPRILEPSAGTGNLLRPLIARSLRDRVPLAITAYEIQEDYAMKLVVLLTEYVTEYNGGNVTVMVGTGASEGAYGINYRGDLQPATASTGGLQIDDYIATSGQKLIFSDLRNADSPSVGSLRV